MAGLVARVRLLVGQGALDLVGDVLDQRAAQHHVQQLLAAADAEQRQVALQGAAGDGRFEGGAAVLGAHRLVPAIGAEQRSEEHTSELQSLMRISYAVFCLKKKNKRHLQHTTTTQVK